jgi:curved DNA-binding protein CbpA
MMGMRGIDELDHYEMLEIARSATPGEIDRAYRLAQETYADGSLALYSIFEKRDAKEIRARLDEAYRVLADPELRSSYDLERASTGTGAEEGLRTDRASVPAAATSEASGPRTRDGGRTHVGAPVSSARLDAAVEVATSGVFEGGAEEYEAEEDSGGDFDGPRLRRTRLFRGYEIEQIADVTKISGLHLRNIEDENFGELPADVYVRGFVTAYARTIGLDPQSVVPGYMARLQEARQQNQKSRFLGLR